MTLFNECIVALGHQTKILSQSQSDVIFDSFEFIYPITNWGQIDWEKVEKKITLESIDQIFPALTNLDKSKDAQTFVLWSNGSAPVIKSDLKKIIENVNDVISVGPDTFLFNPLANYVIEFYHEGELTIGCGKNVKIYLKKKYDDFLNIHMQAKLPNYPEIEIEKKASQIISITGKLLEDKIILEDECVFLNQKFLYSSAWLASNGKKYSLINNPSVLEYAKAIEDLKKQCKGMIAFNKSVALLQDA